MIVRKAYERFVEWKASHTTQALLVTGARQVGKTYLVEQFARNNYQHVVKFDLVDQADVRDAMNAARSSAELFLALSAFAGNDMVPGETVIFIDEVQECREALTLVKYLVQREGFDYILSGSLLGVELADVRSAPVGYLDIIDMYPLDFEEFCRANGVGADAWAEACAAWRERRTVFAPVHERLLRLFHWYLVVGGMPRAVDEFVRSQNIARVCDVQRGILRMYRWDISKYVERNRRLHIKEIFDQMPAQLDSQSKRFSFASLAPRGTYERYEEDFIWLVDAGVALPVRNVVEPKRPLKLVENRSFFKLFMNDVGLLAAACGMDATRDALLNDATVSYGAMYENVVAQELASRGKGLYFFRNRSLGELDFVIEREGAVLPIEVKSGKAYRRHSALTAALKVENWGIEEAVVLCEDNLSVDGPVVYAPVYMMAFL